MVSVLFDVLIALGCHGDDHRTAGLALLQVGNDLVVDRTLRRDGDDGESLVDECNRAVLHLAGGVCLGVQVADLFQLERTLVADGGTHAAPDEERVAGILARARRLLDGGLALGKDALDLLGRVRQLAESGGEIWFIRSLPFAWASSIASSVKLTTWPKNDFVDATAISLFAFV